MDQTERSSGRKPGSGPIDLEFYGTQTQTQTVKLFGIVGLFDHEENAGGTQ